MNDDHNTEAAVDRFEQRLREQLAAIYAEAAERAKPIIAQLAHIESLKPRGPIELTPEQLEAIKPYLPKVPE